MNQQSKTEKKPKTKSKVQIRDLKPKKDTKGGGDFVITKTTDSSSPKML
jgi:hypothetical protein